MSPRCLLSKKAAPVMKLIQSIFSSILKFSSYMRKEGGSIERSYAAMADTHTKFREVSSLLIKGEISLEYLFVLSAITGSKQGPASKGTEPYVLVERSEVSF